ncbi:MAG: radical SAM family heme chaperone HemW [Candidatus Hydrogenedentes bacterium]|nr:radical SAM family heme chaperone HemW [Candidatus Hydrogenedentota bacterium]
MFGIYVHIPYCRTLCPYCDFVKERTGASAPAPFVDALLKEIDAFEGPDEAGSIFFGGGTPSLLEAGDLSRILDALARRFRMAGPEITTECNPDDITPDLVRAFQDCGVNRISLGVQSLDDRVLRYLGRRHDAASALRACDQVAAVFDTWNLDLIFGAPPIDAWPETLRGVRALDPPHVAAYGLTYEAGTPFERKKSEAVDDDTALRLYQDVEAALAEYAHYEISNFAKPGHEAKHNLVYWHNEGYAGFGTGAYSFVDGIRARNHVKTEDYLRAPGAKCESLALTVEEIKVETLIQHFRLREGLPRAGYAARFGVSLEADFGPVLAALQARGWLESTETNVRPTAEGFYLNNEIGLALVDA